MFLLNVVLIALPVLALAQTQDQFHQMAHSLFLESDVNKDGIIDRPEIDATFHGQDANNDGRISRHEFVTFTTSHTDDQLLINIANSLYDRYDVDGDHHLDKHDFDNFYTLLDGNANGIVTEEEFVRYWSVLLSDIAHQHGRK
ncbi:serine/threonine-protein kinase fhkB [Biomphalaria glabrata]|nr:serine/threonine-protein kinase fhkB [Biomphalaria glabrata]